MPVFNHYLNDNRVAAVEIDVGLAVKIGTDDKLYLCGDGEAADGISLNHVDAGYPCTYIPAGGGHPLVTIGANVDVAVNPKLTPAADGSGKLVPAGVGKTVVALAKQNGSTGEQIRAHSLARAQFVA